MSHPHLPQSHPSEIRHVALNSKAPGGKLFAALCFEMPAAEAGKTRADIKTLTLIPAPDANGVVSGTVDGRRWIMRDPHAVVAAFNRARAITENHARVLKAPKGDSAPAFGWIEAIRVGPGGSIEFDPNWNARGTAALNGDDYRWLSPEFEHDQAGVIHAVVGAGILNDPNFTQLALNSEQHQEHSTVDFLAICAALGIDPKSDEAAVIVAINALKQQHQTALNNAQTPDPEKWKPAAELTTALNRATTAEAALDTLKQKDAEKQITDLVDSGVAAGKIIPATREHYVAVCRAQGGVENFMKLLDKMPVIAAPTKTDKKVETGAGELTADELAICSQTGISPDQYKKAKG